MVDGNILIKPKGIVFYTCKKQEIGDEFHVLFKCSLDKLLKERIVFKNKIYECNQQFKYFDDKSLYIYTLSGSNKNMSKITSQYFKKICDITFNEYKKMNPKDLDSWANTCNSTRT